MTPGRRRCRIFSKISFWSVSHVTVLSKYSMNGLPNLHETQHVIYEICSIKQNPETASFPKVPASLLSSTGSVAYQQHYLLCLSTVLIGTWRGTRRWLLNLRGYPVICAILQVVLIKICMWASCLVAQECNEKVFLSQCVSVVKEALLKMEF